MNVVPIRPLPVGRLLPGRDSYIARVEIFPDMAAAPVIILDTVFKIFRGATLIYAAALDPLVPRQTRAFAEHDAAKGDADCNHTLCRTDTRVMRTAFVCW